MTTPHVPPLLKDHARGATIYDSYRAPITNPAVVDADSALRSFFLPSPPWLERLMQLRHRILGRFGFMAGVPGGLDRHFSVSISM